MAGRSAVMAALALAALAAGFAVVAEGGTVEGNVRDGETGDRLLGANVWIIDTSWGAATDDQGNFRIDNVPPGTYDLKVFYVGYAAMVIDSLVVNGGVPTPIVVSLIPEAVEIKEIVVSAQRVLSTSAAILVNRKKAAAISDAISAEQIAGSPDATSGDALARVTGISIHDDKFIFIRGITDRYNGASINGVTVTSTDTDVDKKSFAFDMIPANLLENGVVVKTMTPDKAGDLAGGVVELNTMAFPSARVTSASASCSYDSRSSTRTVLASRGGGTDWLGYDDGARALPEDKQGYDLAKTLPNTWAIRPERAPLNKSLSLSFGDSFKWGRRALGIVAAASYRNGYEAVGFVERPTYRGYPISDFSGARYSRSASWGLLAGLSYRVSDRHSLNVEADLAGSGTDKISASSGLPASGEFTDKQTVEWDQRSFALAKIVGDHRLGWGGLQAGWKVFWTASSASEPDRKFVTYERGASEVSTMKENYRTWSDLNEHTAGLSADLTLSLGDRSMKVGLETSRRERDFDIKAFSTDIADVSPENYDLLVLPLEAVFEPGNYGPGKFSFVPVTVFTGAYGGERDLVASYALADWGFGALGRDLRVVGGVRLEDFDQRVNTVKAVDDPVPMVARVHKIDVLPSANMTCALGGKTNLRLAYSHTVNRPEFREMANVLYYDFDREQNVKGNPELRRALIRSGDIRIEVFPGIGEVVACSYFRKEFTDAIEEQLIPSPERYLRTWFNSPKGRSWGWELEARKSLGLIWSPLSGLVVGTNYSRLHSEISYTHKYTLPDGTHVADAATRPMQGQAPWTMNASLALAVERTGTAISLLYNKIGRRLVAVGDTRDEDVFEEPRGALDLGLTQRLTTRLDSKLTIKDMGDRESLLTSGPLREPHSRISRGISYSLSISAKL